VENATTKGRQVEDESQSTAKIEHANIQGAREKWRNMK
jgi:hypothetical protein